MLPDVAKTLSLFIEALIASNPLRLLFSKASIPQYDPAVFVGEWVSKVVDSRH